MPGFGRWKRGGASQDQVMAVDVQLEDHIRNIEGLVDGYLRTSRDEAMRQALVAELEKLDDQTARADAYSDLKAVLVRYQVPRSLLIGATCDTSIREDVPSAEFKAQMALVKAARNAIRNTTAEAQSVLQKANGLSRAAHLPGRPPFAAGGGPLLCGEAPGGYGQFGLLSWKESRCICRCWPCRSAPAAPS